MSPIVVVAVVAVVVVDVVVYCIWFWQKMSRQDAKRYKKVEDADV